jgi:hypothetical protein
MWVALAFLASDASCARDVGVLALTSATGQARGRHETNAGGIVRQAPLAAPRWAFRNDAAVTPPGPFAVSALFNYRRIAPGQLFIFYTIRRFGPVVFTIMMTTRQMLSMMVSCWLYGHALGAGAAAGALVVFATLFYKISGKYRVTARTPPGR